VRCASACVEPSFLRRVCDAYAQCRAGAPGFEPRGVRVRKELPPRNELLRRRALELVARVLADWPSRVLTDQNADCLACATRCLLSGLADPCMGVRRAARACFEVYEAVWPREAESLVFELDPHGRQLVLGGALSGDPGDERNDTGSRWALGGARAFARRETRDGRVAAVCRARRAGSRTRRVPRLDSGRGRAAFSVAFAGQTRAVHRRVAAGGVARADAFAEGARAAAALGRARR
jgi:hypothetical protein